MANVSYGDIVTELKGGSSGRVYQKSLYGTVQRRRVKPVNRATSFQMATRRAIATLNRQWGTLTETLRQAWIAAAILPLTGANLYCSRNFDNFRYNLPQVTDPNYTPVPDSPGDPGLNGSVATPTVHLTYTIFKGYVTFDIDWGDGTIVSYPLANLFDVQHTYAGSPAVDILGSISDKSYTWSISSNAGGNLTDFSTGAPGLIGLDLHNEKLTVTTVNSILTALDGFNTQFGTLDISGQSPAAAPTGAGITAKENLIAKGWTVLTD